VGAISPIFASISLTERIEGHEAGFVYAHPNFDPDAFISRAARRLGPDDIVRVEGDDFLGLMLFQFSGAKLATRDDTRLMGNDLRIRFKELARRWDRRVEGAGFSADYVAVPVADVSSGADVVCSGEYRSRRWVLIRARASN
jgi:hypothetical protein